MPARDAELLAAMRNIGGVSIMRGSETSAAIRRGGGDADRAAMRIS